MDNEKIKEQFEKGIKYKGIGFLLILLSPGPMALLKGSVKYILASIIFGIGVYFERQYKCPVCGHVFDPRVKSKELTYCSNCGKKLQ
ncbi:hypothetical protein RBU49_08600 [Clostridium sp. MB40-C1]|uniref:hypothetical protein n=1 Tax=Clostridium sp. MB40-C1 TaxID=3070996 RepID=UPI0027DF0346|nr:hypothetical protein [Clostridium sp. MB40-C1]WMJ82292.1 hypothetical protein RBU49_08600 [Clostridium sp. MB40-C1]